MDVSYIFFLGGVLIACATKVDFSPAFVHLLYEFICVFTPLIKILDDGWSRLVVHEPNNAEESMLWEYIIK